MSIAINSFGGPLIWLLRKHCSGLTSIIMLKLVQVLYRRGSKLYIDWFMEQDTLPLPLNVMIETINRCNGKCSFCPANTNDEKREYKRMPEEIYYGIITQLKDLKWHGKLFLCVNNEPFIDKRIMEFARYARNELSGVKIALISNGTLLDENTLDSMVGAIDQITINDYSENYVFSPNIKRLITHIKNNPNSFENIDFTFNRRYNKEILATRAGNAPNKPNKNIKVNAPCLYPFTDIVIFPDGKVGMCCNDCYEVTNYGYVTTESLVNIWRGQRFRGLRNMMMDGRNHPFCKECDVVDAGEREKAIKQVLRRKENK